MLATQNLQVKVRVALHLLLTVYYILNKRRQLWQRFESRWRGWAGYMLTSSIAIPFPADPITPPCFRNMLDTPAEKSAENKKISH